MPNTEPLSRNELAAFGPAPHLAPRRPSQHGWEAGSRARMA